MFSAFHEPARAPYYDLVHCSQEKTIHVKTCNTGGTQGAFKTAVKSPLSHLTVVRAITSSPAGNISDECRGRRPLVQVRHCWAAGICEEVRPYQT